MRQLHVVALSEDGRFLLLAPSKEATKDGGKGVKPSFRLPLDARLSAAVRGDLPRPGQTSPPVSGLTPKEIQARLRAGESVEQVARAAGVPAARVERFAGPVEGERVRTIDAARAAVLTRARRGASAVSLGEAVTEHLVEAGVDPAEVEWTARREDSGSWLVSAAFSVRGRKKRSTWRYEPGTRDLTAIDASSAVLGYVEPPTSEAHPTSKVVSAVRPAPRRKAGKRKAATSRVPAVAQAPEPAAGTSRRRAPAPVLPKAPARTPRAAAVAAPAGATRPAPAAGTTVTARPPSTTVRPTAAAASPARTRAAPASRAAPATTAAAPTSTKAGPTRTKAAPAAKRAVPAKTRATPATTEATSPPPPADLQPAPPDGPPQLRVVPAPQDEPRQRASVPAWADVLLSTTPPSRPADPQSDDD